MIPPANEFKLRSLGEKQEKFLGIDLSPDGHLTQRGLSAGLHIGYAGLKVVVTVIPSSSRVKVSWRPALVAKLMHQSSR